MKILELLNFKKKNKAIWNEYYKGDNVKFKIPEGSIYNLIKNQVGERDGFIKIL